MAQYWIDQLHCLARPGERCAVAADYDGAKAAQGHGYTAGGRGLIFGNTSGARVWSAVTVPVGPLADVDLRVQFRQIATPVDSFSNFGLSFFVRHDQVTDNFVHFAAPSQAGSTSYGGLYKFFNGSIVNAAAAFTGPAKASNIWQWLRFRLVGANYQMGVDLTQSAALSSPVAVNLTGAPGAGGIGLICASYFGGGPLYEIESFAVGTDGDAPPTGPTGCANVSALSGTVTDHEGNPCAREVRVFLRATGALVGYTTSDAETGAWSVPTQFAGLPHDVVAQDDAAAPSLIDMIASNVVP